MFLIVRSCVALAQNPTGADTKTDKEDIKKVTKNLSTAVGAANFTPNGNGAISNIISNFNLSSTLEEGVNGKIDLKYSKNYFTYGISLAQKLSEGDKKATLYDFNKGLSPGTTLGANIQYMLWKNKKSLAYQDVFLNVKSRIAKYQGIAAAGMTLDTVLKYATPEEQLKLAGSDKSPVFFNLTVSFTKTQFSYTTDSVNLSPIDENKITPNINFAVGVPFSFKSYLAVTYSYSETYDEGSSINFIRPFGTTDNSYTQTLTFGAPSHVIDHKITAEYRRNFDRIKNLAIAPSIIYGIKSERLAFTLPVYFIKGITKEKEAKGLQGGLSFGYVTGTKTKWVKFKDGFGAQLILTAPFSVFTDMF